MKRLVMATAIWLSALPVLAQNSPVEERCDSGKCNWAQMVEIRAAKEKLALKKFPSDGIEKYMPIGRTSETGIPETVQGIWWLDFHQQGDLLCSFGTAKWDEAARIATVPVYGPGAFSFHGTETGASSYYPLLSTHFTYIVQFSDNDRYAVITPELDFLGHRIRIPHLVVKFAMRYVDEGHWVRESWLFGKRVPDYDFKRIVGPDGKRDATYADYLKVADPESYLAVSVNDAAL